MSDQVAQDLAQFVRVARARLGVSVRHVAEKAGVSHPYITQIERGYVTYPRPQTLERIAKALDVPVEEAFAVVGYDSRELPSLPVYLRSKYAMTGDEVHEVEEVIRKQNQRRKTP
jgi:transcriptional regulator with XRE-family HTH domain